ncbi:MerR family transcriptional regulator [Lentilactobacillus kosonis]|uniref:Transcriptional regulator, MerR family n=1 Tax=Lentilactobacillus kosonis TaxID=2810561 RepID=A0A401FHX4_9LACO|nr:MerR family transcriptional regulator [Lentilactobacillus kosonis]GAY71947.1 transcriptional regulator, MerR family [Lentilactobacillus kosonis]
MQYSIGEFSKISGLTIDTLRFYEKQGIVFSNRSENNQRYYTDKDTAWIEFVIRLKKTGMSIKKMQKYAKLRYEGDSTIPDRLVLLFDQLDVLHENQKQVEDHIEFLEQKIKTYLGLNDK